MSSPLPMQPPSATLDDDAWEDLLDFIEELHGRTPSGENRAPSAV